MTVNSPDRAVKVSSTFGTSRSGDNGLRVWPTGMWSST